ncbi:MAG: signal transduction histidine kinase/ligand-binding sensor domain-containing protein/ActR [Verrucomicrobiales bacterium]
MDFLFGHLPLFPNSSFPKSVILHCRKALATALLMSFAFSSCWLRISEVQADVDERIIFANLSTQNGMSDGGVHRIVFDNEGAIWIGTENGLTEFNGIRLRSYELETDSSGKKWVGGLRSIAADKGGWFWIGTAGDGLARFQPKTGKTVWFRSESGNLTSLSHNSVTSLHIHSDGGLWIGTENGLNRFNRSTSQFEQIALGESTENKVIHSIITDREGKLWVATNGGGLYRQNETSDWVEIWNEPSEISALSADTEKGIWMATLGSGLFRISQNGTVLTRVEIEANVLSLHRDSKGTLWAGTSRGLGRFMAKSGEWIWYENDTRDEGSIVAGPITTIFEDKREVLWLGAAADGGVSRFSLMQSWFPKYAADPAVPTSLSHSGVRGFASSLDGSIWIGTEGGLNRFDPETGESVHFRQDAAHPGSLPRNFAPVVMEDSQGRLWVGTSGGLGRLDSGMDSFEIFQHEQDSFQSIPGDTITALLETEDGNIWVGVLGNGLVRWEESSDSFVRIDTGIAEGVRQHVTDLHEDEDGRLWVATFSDGLWWYDSISQSWSRYLDLCDDKDIQLSSQNITDLAGGSNSTIWIGMKNGGFSRFDPNAGTLKNYTPRSARLPHSDAFSVAEDDEGQLWVATGAGLIRFNPKVRENPKASAFRKFGQSDGLQSSTFYTKSIHKAVDGRIYVGGPGGFNIIDPQNLPKPLLTTRPLLTSLKLYGNEIDPDRSDILTRPLAATEQFDVAYDPRLSMTIGFGTMNYASSSKTRYRYMLEGHDNNWRLGDATLEANYTHLNPGNYTFLAQASDGSLWLNDRARVRIRILPPWYQTRWAMISFGTGGTLLLGFILFSLHRSRANREQTRQQQLESERSRAEAALARQIQRAMLLERTTAEFRSGLDSAEMFNATLARLSDHFRVARCYVAFCSEGDEGFAEILSEHVTDPAQPFARRELPTATPVMRQLLNSDTPFAKDRSSVITPDEIAPFHVLADDNVQSLLAVRTVHSDLANGLIVLHHFGEKRIWTDDETKMLQSLAGQIGIAIAQFRASEREAQQNLELEEARRVADEANDAKSEFLAKMTHEVRTPLNAIIGFTEVMTQEAELTKMQLDHLGIINSSGEHLLGVINDILEVSQIEAGGSELTPEVFELEQLLSSVSGMVQMKAEAKGIGLEIVKLTELPVTIEADKGKLRQILLNLLGNAVKFTEKGGVALRVGVCDSEPENPETPDRRNLRLEFGVFDTGPGISEIDQSRLFQKFVQTELGKRATQGTGLGLAISKSFSELMGGKVDLMSRIGFGTLFTLEIPCVEHIQKAPSAGSGSEAIELGTVVGLEPGHEEIRVLVAEDQPLNRLLMQKLLSSAGFTLQEAEDGVIAVEKWRSWRPHIIFMDEDMPNMRGTDATRKILAEAPANERPIIVSLTAFAMEDQRQAAMEAGCAEFLAKPFKREDLFEIIARTLPVRYTYKNLDQAA